MVDDADAYDDALTRLKLQFQALALNVLPALSTALQTLNMLVDTGPGFWDGLAAAVRNTMREITGAIDGMTHLATLGFWGTHLSDKFNGKAADLAEPGGFRGDGLGMGTNPMDALGPSTLPPPPTKAKRSQRRPEGEGGASASTSQVFGRANMDEAMRAPDKLAFQGVSGHPPRAPWRRRRCAHRRHRCPAPVGR
jgi:hypothetical protein